jgi:hypothetical protein
MRKRMPWLCEMMGMVLGLSSPAFAQTTPAPEEDIREARGLVEIPTPPEPSYLAWWIALGVMVAAAVIWCVVKFQRSRREKISPLGVAMARLREIETRQAEWDDETYAIHVADALRTFVVGAYGIAAPQRTSQEFLQECVRLERWQEHSLGTLRELLRSCDIAKFASGSLTALDRQDMLAKVRELVLVPLTPPQKPLDQPAA